MSEPGKSEDRAGRREGAPLRLFGGVVSGMNAEMIEISIIGIVFMQLADSLRRSVLTRSDGLFNQVMLRRPAIAHVMGIVTQILGAAFMIIILLGSIPYLGESWKKNYYIGVEGMFTAPVWPIALIIVVGVFVTMVQFLVLLAGHVRAMRAPHSPDSGSEAS